MLTPGPTMLSCPACAGVLRAELTPTHHVTFICSVGHRFSLPEVYVAKEDQVEYAQWSLIVLLKHLQLVLQHESESDPPNALAMCPDDLQQRLEQIARHITLVERMIEDTRLPPLRDGRGTDAHPVSGSYE